MSEILRHVVVGYQENSMPEDFSKGLPNARLIMLVAADLSSGLEALAFSLLSEFVRVCIVESMWFRAPVHLFYLMVGSAGDMNSLN